MATVEAYTKAGVDAKFNSRSNMTIVHSGGGTPDIAAFPDAKTGDIIERSGDGARWRVLARNLNPAEGRVVSVAGKSGVVTLAPSDVGAAPATHTHTKAQITDLNASAAAGANTIAQRDSAGRLTVVAPTLGTHAATKKYVDDTVSSGATWSSLSGKPSSFPPSTHTHTIAQITDLNVSPNSYAGTIAQRGTDGTLRVGTPTLAGHAANKKYVDDKVASPVSWANLSGKPSTFTPSTHTHSVSQITGLNLSSGALPWSTAQRSASGHLEVARVPTIPDHAASKQYVDSQIQGSSDWSVITGKPSTFTPSTHSHTQAQVTGLPAKLATYDTAVSKVNSAVSTVSGSTTDGGSLLVLSSSGRLGAVNPSGATDVANKQYVDSEISSKTTWANTSGKPATFPPSSHTHTVDQITGLTLSQNATGSSVVQRDSSGRITVGTPSATGHATTKAYVDNAVTAGKAWAAITGKPSTYTPSAHTHRTTDIEGLNLSNGALPYSTVQRTASGHVEVARSPTIADHATSKLYVDNVVAASKAWSAITGKPETFTPSAHTHTVSQITGLNIEVGAIAHSIVKRTASGHVEVARVPTGPDQATSKQYVDNAIAAAVQSILDQTT